MADSDETTERPEDSNPPAIMAKADPQPIAAPAPAKRGGGFVAPVVGGALAAALGFGLAQFVPGGWPVQDTASLEAKLADQTNTIAKLETRLATVESTKMPDISPLMETLSALNGRVAGLENGPAEQVEDLNAIKDALAALEARIAALPADTAPQGAIPASVAALAAEAEMRLQEAEAQAAQMKAEAEALTRAAVAQAAFGRLQAAVDAGTPFATILPDLGQEAPDALGAYAESGLPSLASLQETFPEAARLAIEAALRANMGDSWTERATSFLLSQTGARSLTPREGNDPDAILSRAEAALGAGDLEKVLGELSSLPEPAQAAMVQWRAQAKVRQDGVRALADLATKIGG